MTTQNKTPTHRSKNSLINIDVVLELDAHGLIVKPEHLHEAKAAVEDWLHNEIRQFIREMLQQQHVEFEEEQI